MPLRNLKPMTFKPKGLSDAIDGTNAFEGAMLSLQNLVHAQSTANVFVPRSASVKIVDFSATFNTPGFISLQQTIGSRVYGLLKTNRNPGYDEPFCYDLVAEAFVTVTGVTANNVPASPATAGDWTPPTLSDVTNGRIVVTHPGFVGGSSGLYFGWFDVSSFSLNTLKGNLTSGSPIIASINDGASSDPIADGVQVGFAISGAGIPAGATVIAVSNGTFSLDTTAQVNGTTAVTNVANLTGVQVGMSVTGPLYPAGAYVAAITGANSFTLSVAALGTASGTVTDFAGGGTITMSANATATANSEVLTITGGTPAAPAWGAGNTNGNPLLTPPAAVLQFNSRAYYAVNNALVFSDTLNPNQVTNASQAVLLGDSQPITALAGQPLVSEVTGGIVQSFFAFKGAQSYFQITGDADLANLAINVIAGSVGTLAPLTLCETPLGLAYVAPDGLRIVNPESGLCSPPIGAYGSGVSLPFINVDYPSRMCAAYGQNTIRFSLHNVQADGQPYQEFCFNMQQEAWTGPHTFPASNTEFCPEKGGFIFQPQTIPGQLWFHSLLPSASDEYTENGVALSWVAQTTLFPDNGEMRMNKIVRTTIAMAMPPTQSVAVTIYDETSSQIDQVTVVDMAPPGTGVGVWSQSNWGGATWGPLGGPGNLPGGVPWGQGIWGQFLWGAATGYLKQRRVAWHLPIIFKQGTLSCAGASQAGFAIGNMYAGYQILGYLLEDGL